MSLAVAELINFTGSRSPCMTPFRFLINPTVMQTSESWILCVLEPDLFLTLNEHLSVSFRSLNVSKLEMVAGKDADLALVLVLVAALPLTLLVVPTCEILSPHFGQKKKNTILEAYSHTFHRRPQLSNTRVGPQKGLGKLLSLDPGRVRNRMYFCTETQFCTGRKTYICTGVYILLYWNIYTYCCIGIYIVVLSL